MISVKQFLKDWTLPVAIAVGTVAYLVFAFVPELDAAGDALLPVFETLLPLTIFLTLFVTFSKVYFHLMRLHRWHFYLLLAQLLLIGLLVALTLFLPPALTGEGSGKGAGDFWTFLHFQRFPPRFLAFPPHS